MAVILTAALLTPFPAHTGTELEAWGQDWARRSVDNLTVDLMDEWRDMRGRHEWWFDPQPTVTVAARVMREVVGPLNGMGNGNVEQWRSLVAVYFPADQVDRALRVMACESGGNPNAYNPSGASGLMQVLASWADNFGYQPADLFDPSINLYVASLLYYDGGWAHWTASRGCW